MERNFEYQFLFQFSVAAKNKLDVLVTYYYKKSGLSKNIQQLWPNNFYSKINDQRWRMRNTWSKFLASKTFELWQANSASIWVGTDNQSTHWWLLFNMQLKTEVAQSVLASARLECNNNCLLLSVIHSMTLQSNSLWISIFNLV